LHLETVNLADGDYKLVPADSRVDQEVNLNCANLSQDLGQAPEAFLPDSAQEGTNFEDLFASLTWPCTLHPGWSVEWDGPSAGADHPPAE